MAGSPVEEGQPKLRPIDKSFLTVEGRGYDDAMAGKSREANPYGRGNSERYRRAWFSGWDRVKDLFGEDRPAAEYGQTKAGDYGYKEVQRG